MDRLFPPLYFPTNVVLLDDDTNFLKHFSLLLDSRLPCRPFNSAKAALDRINSQASLLHIFTEFANVATSEDVEQHTYVDLNRLHQLVYRNDRFSQITVAIIDYDMPEMNGIEVCKKIAHPEIKKILLTGKADEKLAVEAFNAGLINQFIQKSNDNVEKYVNQAVEKLQLDYFSDITNSISINLHNGTASFLADRGFNKKVMKLVRENKIIEFYFWENPKGFLMLDETGRAYFLFVMSKDVLDTHYDMALECQAPEELTKLIKDYSHIPWFPTPDGYYTTDCQPDWRDHIYRVDFTCGEEDLNFCTLVSPVPLDTPELSKILPFESYLKSFDEKYAQLQ